MIVGAIVRLTYQKVHNMWVEISKYLRAIVGLDGPLCYSMDCLVQYLLKTPDVYCINIFMLRLFNKLMVNITQCIPLFFTKFIFFFSTRRLVEDEYNSCCIWYKCYKLLHLYVPVTLYHSCSLLMKSQYLHSHVKKHRMTVFIQSVTIFWYPCFLPLIYFSISLSQPRPVFLINAFSDNNNLSST